MHRCLFMVVVGEYISVLGSKVMLRWRLEEGLAAVTIDYRLLPAVSPSGVRPRCQSRCAVGES